MSGFSAEPRGLRAFRAVLAALSAGERHRRLASLACLLAVVAIAAAAIITGAVRTFYYGHDIFVVLAGAWRFVNGQAAHVDYASWWGPIPAMVFGVGLLLRHNSVTAFGCGLGIASGTLGAATWALCRRRMLPLPTAMASLGVALLVAAPFPLGLRPQTLSPAMSYNRWGYALAAMILLEAFASPAGESDALVGGLIAGAACAAAFFIKASYSFIGIAFLAASLVIRRPAWRVLGILAGAAAVSLALMAYLRFDFRDMLGDLAIAGNARSTSISGWGIRWALIDQTPEFLPLLAAAVLLFVDPWNDRSEPSGLRHSPLLASILVFFAGAMLLASNAQAAGFPLIAFVAVVVLNTVLRRGALPLEAAPYRCAIVALAVLCYLPRVAADGAGLVYGLVQHRRPVPAGVARFDPPHLRELVLMDVEDPRDWEARSNGATYVAYINDGVDLVRKNSAPSESVMTFDVFDPLSFALLRKPAEGGTISMGFGNTFVDNIKPSPERFFGKADIVMVPKYPAAPESTVLALERNYGAYLRQQFDLCAQSGRWWLYKQPGASKECPEQLRSK